MDALRLLHDRADDGEFEVANLVTGHNIAHVRLKDGSMKRLAYIAVFGAKGAQMGRDKRSLISTYICDSPVEVRLKIIRDTFLIL